MPEIISTPKTPGEQAGNIDIRLQQQGSSSINIEGSHRLEIRRDEKLDLIATGANGLPGRIGYKGLDGLNGEKGINATKNCPGGPGAPGGSGGHGEAGSDGGPAGNGGSVDVRVSHEDLALLDVIDRIDVSPGEPGKKGVHGAGGRGGRGGDGGDAYTWYEGDTGERGDNGIGMGATQKRKKVTAGGQAGQDGLPGGQHRSILVDGARGRPGRVSYHVVQEDATSVEYTGRYKLALTHVEFKPTQDHGVFEPGDTVEAVYEIKNTGPMISPAETIPLILNEEKQIDLMQMGQVPGNILPATVDRTSVSRSSVPLKFRISPECSNGQVLSLNVAAQNTRLQRPYHTLTTRLRINYPVHLEAQPSEFLIRQNSAVVLEAVVQSIATKPLGRKFGRDLKIEISAGDSVLDTIPIESIVPKQELNSHFTPYKGNPPKMEFGDRQVYHIDLLLQSIDKRTECLVQRQTITGTYVPQYTPPRSKLLLVINSSTTKAAIAYWSTFFRELSGDNAATYAVSCDDKLKLDGGHSFLLENLSGGTVFFLDNLFPNGHLESPQHITQHITQDQLFKAAEHKVSLVAVGPKKIVDSNGRWPLMLQSPKRHDSIDDLIQCLFNESPKPVLYKLDMTPRRWFFMGPEPAKKIMDRIRHTLAKTFPNRTYYVAQNSYNASRMSLDVGRIPTPPDQYRHQIELSLDQLADPQSYASIPAFTIDALPFAQKLDLFIKQSSAYHRKLLASLTRELLDEQALVMGSQAYGSWLERIRQRNQRDFTQEFQKMKLLVGLLGELSRDDLNYAQACGPLIINMIAQVQYHAKQHSSFWTRLLDWFLPQTKEKAIQDSVTLCDQAITACGGLFNTSDEAKKAFRDEVQLIDLAERLRVFTERPKSMNPLSSFFFSKPKPDTINAAAALRAVCLKRGDSDRLEDYRHILCRSSELKAFFAEFKRLIPEFEREPLDPANGVANGVVQGVS